MPNLEVKIEPWFRGQNESVILWITNKTSHLLTGSVVFRDVPQLMRGLPPGTNTSVSLASTSLIGEENTITLALQSQRKPDYKIREDLTLKTYTFGSFAIDVTDEGCKCVQGVRFFWREGSPEFRPLVFVTDGSGNLHRLGWGWIADGGQGEARECHIDGGVKRVEVSGAFRVNGEEFDIGEDSEGISLEVEEPDAGVYHLVRRLVTDD